MSIYKYESILQWADSQYTTKAAIELTDLDIPVFPCKPDKSPNTPHGFKDATTDRKRIAGMFTQPGLSIGMPTGSASGLTVVDIDPKNGGDKSVRTLNIPSTRTAETPSGGVHFYFKDARIRNSASLLAPGVDVRGEGGYVIVPPSKGYKWLNDAEPVDYPAHLIPNKNKGVKLRATGLDTKAIRKGVPAGQRNDLIFRGLCQYRHFNKPIEEAKEWAAEVAMNSNPPYDEVDTDEIAERVYAEYEPGNDFITPEEKAETERQERVKRAQEAWDNSNVQQIARSRDILDRFHRELKAAGVVGEERLIKLLFVAGHSRLLDRPISLIIKGPSSTGKSYVTEQALINSQPNGAVKFLTGMSEHALVYSDDDYRHKIINIAEQAGINSEFLDYTIRTLLSENRIEYETVMKIDGRQQVVKKSKEGPTGLVLATTKANLYHDNETRAVSVWTTDTPEQTAAIMEATADEDREGMDFEPWKAFGTWLEGQDNEVWTPYAKSLSKQIKAVHVRQRRDFKLLLNAIKTLAIMHQANRERDYRGRIVATLRDYEMAHDLLNDLLSQGIGATVSETIKETVRAVRELTIDADPPLEYVTNKDVEGKLNLDKSSVSARVNKALSEGYLVNLQELGRRGNKLAVGSDLPEDTPLLPEPQDMARAYMNTELATLCNLVCQLGTTRRGKPDASLFADLVGKIVGLGLPPKASVLTSGKPYDDVFGLDKPDLESNGHEEEESGCTPPEPSQQTNNVTKSPESVTSSDGPAVAQPTNEPAQQIVGTIYPPYHDLSRNPVYPDDSDPDEIEEVADAIHRCAIEYADALLFPDRYNVGHWSEYLEDTGYGFFSEEVIAAALEEHGDTIYELRGER